MRKNTRRLLIAAAAVAVLGGAYAALLLNPEEEESTTETTELTAVDTSDAASIHVTTRDGEDFTLTLSSDDSGTTYSMSGDDLDYSQSLMQELLDAACAISGTQVEEDCDSLADYGLSEDDDCDTIVLTDTDGGETTLRLGLANDLLGSYCTKDDGTAVYLLDSDTVTALTRAQSYYRNLTVLGSYYCPSCDLPRLTIETPEDGEVFAIAARDTSDMDDDVASAYSDFVFTAPVSCDADDTELTDGLLSPLQSGLTAEGIAADSADDLSQYGLDNPVRIHITANNLDETVLIGSETASGSSVYVKTESSDTIYTCTASYFTFLEDDWTDWRSATLVNCALTEVQTITVTQGETTHTAEFTYTPADENEEEDEDETTATLDGEDMDDDAMQQLFGAVTSVDFTREAEESEATSDTDAAAVTLTLTDGTTHTMAFRKGGSREYLVSVDGGGYVYGVPQAELESVLSAAGFETE